jgi:hypothetical protein
MERMSSQSEDSRCSAKNGVRSRCTDTPDSSETPCGQGSDTFFPSTSFDSIPLPTNHAIHARPNPASCTISSCKPDCIICRANNPSTSCQSTCDFRSSIFAPLVLLSLRLLSSFHSLRGRLSPHHCTRGPQFQLEKLWSLMRPTGDNIPCLERYLSAGERKHRPPPPLPVTLFMQATAPPVNHYIIRSSSPVGAFLSLESSGSNTRLVESTPQRPSSQRPARTMTHLPSTEYWVPRVHAVHIDACTYGAHLEASRQPKANQNRRFWLNNIPLV